MNQPDLGLIVAELRQQKGLTLERMKRSSSTASPATAGPTSRSRATIRSPSNSAIGPEVLTGPDGETLAHKSAKFTQKLRDFDAVIIAGQFKSHCVAWTVADLLADCQAHDPRLAEKIYLLEDCTSSVVVPGAIDYTDEADAAYRRFAEAGMHLVRWTDPIASWPGIPVGTRQAGS